MTARTRLINRGKRETGTPAEMAMSHTEKAEEKGKAAIVLRKSIRSVNGEQNLAEWR